MNIKLILSLLGFIFFSLTGSAMAADRFTVGERVHLVGTNSDATILAEAGDGTFTVQFTSGDLSGTVGTEWAANDLQPATGESSTLQSEALPDQEVGTCSIRSRVSVGHVGVYQVYTRQGQRIGTFYSQAAAINFAEHDTRCIF